MLCQMPIHSHGHIYLRKLLLQPFTTGLKSQSLCEARAGMKAASDLKMIGFGMMVGTLPGAGFLGGGSWGVLDDGRAVKYINYIRAAAAINGFRAEEKYDPKGEMT